ncbi:DNA-processing protein DprA [Paracoccus pacificus]|uniref:DNA-processing protein DprA n=1 Tax=Paracoccus pacificus TaxID=1463598 RepID=A0ABW4RAF4_9RHOB
MRLLSFKSQTPDLGTAGDDLLWLRLIRSRRVGPATFHKLMAQNGSAPAAFEALPEMARAAGMSDYTPCPEGVAAAELRAGRQAGATLIRWDSPDYPELLRELPDAPPVLWVRGRIEALGRPMVAVVGARNASSLGLRMAAGLAGGLARAEICVVAGLARGIDTAAHRATTDHGTIAVMAGGIDVIYPPENRALADAICETGALVTEQPPGTEPQARHFPLRNRIIAGVACGTVVIEAAHRSGSLITARHALDHGREVMAVPGHPMDARSAGTNALIRDGARLVRNAADVIEALGHAAPPTATAPMAEEPRTLAPEQPGSVAAAETSPEKILERLGAAPTEESMILRDLGLTPAELAQALLNLELQGLIERLPGARLIRI